jgi:VWFA-related protein
MRRQFVQLVACTALIAFGIQVAAAQRPTLKTRTREERERAYEESRRITINVQVTDDAGKPVTDVEAKDFTILDNHQPRKLALFHVIDGEAMNDATALVILLDAVNSTPQALEAEKSGIFKYLASSHGPLPYPTSFVLWSNGHLKSTGATTDRNAVGRAFVSFTKGLHSNACVPEEQTANQGKEPERAVAAGKNTDDGNASEAHCLQVHFEDSIAALKGIAQHQVHVGGRTILVWVGPGWPLPSESESQGLTPKEQKGYSATLVAMLGDLRAAQVTVDALGARDAKSPVMTASLKASGEAAASVGNLALPLLAQQTGGRVIAASEDIVKDLASLCADAKWYYALTFNPPPAQNGVELHSLEVKVDRPATHVRTMTTYYSEP